MRGGLRRPFRPSQVVCVLVAVLLTAAFSLQSGSTSRTGTSTDKYDFDNLGAHPSVGTIAAVPGKWNSIALKSARTIPAVHNDGDNFFAPPVTKRSSTKMLAIAVAARAQSLDLTSQSLGLTS